MSVESNDGFEAARELTAGFAGEPERRALCDRRAAREAHGWRAAAGRMTSVALALLAVDGAVTLLGQPSLYWAGFRELCAERNPVGEAFLSHGPWSFVVLLILWGALAVLGARLLPPQAAFVWAALVAAGHAHGAATWLHEWNPCGVTSAGLFILAVCLLAAFSAAALFRGRLRGRVVERLAPTISALLIASAAAMAEPAPDPYADASSAARRELELGKTMAAERFLVECVRVAEGSGEPARLALACAELARFYGDYGRREAAEAYFERAAAATAGEYAGARLAEAIVAESYGRFLLEARRLGEAGARLGASARAYEAASAGSGGELWLARAREIRETVPRLVDDESGRSEAEGE